MICAPTFRRLNITFWEYKGISYWFPLCYWRPFGASVELQFKNNHTGDGWLLASRLPSPGGRFRHVGNHRRDDMSCCQLGTRCRGSLPGRTWRPQWCLQTDCDGRSEDNEHCGTGGMKQRSKNRFDTFPGPLSPASRFGPGKHFFSDCHHIPASSFLSSFFSLRSATVECNTARSCRQPSATEPSNVLSLSCAGRP